MKKRAVFLDRDGVLNRAVIKEGLPYPPNSIDKVEIMTGAVEALKQLKEAGFMLIVVSNQPDVARSTLDKETVDKINKYLAESMPIDRFIICYHDNNDECNCRKPRPGMLFAGAQEFDIDLSLSYMIGDRWRDIEAGERAGCKTIFIDYGYFEKQPESVTYKVKSLEEAVQIILGGTNEKS